MRKAIALTALLLSPLAAQAADLPTISKPGLLGSQFPYEATGFYYGLTAIGAAESSNLSVPTGSTGSLVNTGAAIGATFGYQHWSNGSFFAAEGTLAYQNLGGTQATTLSDIQSNVKLLGRAKFGGPWVNFLNMIPAIQSAFPALPAPSGPSQAHPYLMVGLHADRINTAQIMGATGSGWELRPSIGAGVLTQVVNPGTTVWSGMVLDTWMEYLPASKGVSVASPTGTANLGNAVMVGASLLW